MAGKKDLVPDPTVIGEISAPPFVQLPDPGALLPDGRSACVFWLRSAR